MSKYLIALDGYSQRFNNNSYAIIDNVIQELKSVKGTKVFNIENWVDSNESVDYDIIQIPKDIKVFKVNQTREHMHIKTKISFENEIDAETKLLLEKYFKNDDAYEFTFEYSNVMAISDTLEGLKTHVSETDFASRYFCDEEMFKEICDFFNA